MRSIITLVLFLVFCSVLHVSTAKQSKVELLLERVFESMAAYNEEIYPVVWEDYQVKNETIDNGGNGEDNREVIEIAKRNIAQYVSKWAVILEKKRCKCLSKELDHEKRHCIEQYTKSPLHDFDHACSSCIQTMDLAGLLKSNCKEGLSKVCGSKMKNKTSLGVSCRSFARDVCKDTSTGIEAAEYCVQQQLCPPHILTK